MIKIIQLPDKSHSLFDFKLANLLHINFITLDFICKEFLQDPSKKNFQLEKPIGFRKLSQNMLN